MASSSKLPRLVSELKRERAVLGGLFQSAFSTVKRVLGITKDGRSAGKVGGATVSSSLRAVEASAGRASESVKRGVREAVRAVEAKGTEVRRSTRAAARAAETGVARGTTAAKHSLAGSKAHTSTRRSARSKRAK